MTELSTYDGFNRIKHSDEQTSHPEKPQRPKSPNGLKKLLDILSLKRGIKSILMEDLRKANRAAYGTDVNHYAVYVNDQTPETGNSRIRSFEEKLDSKFGRDTMKRFSNAVMHWEDMQSGHTLITQASIDSINQHTLDETKLKSEGGNIIYTYRNNATELLNAIDASQLTETALYRGMDLPQTIIDSLENGTIFGMPLVSTSRKRGVAERYSGNTTGNLHPVMLKIEPGAKAIRVSEYGESPKNVFSYLGEPQGGNFTRDTDKKECVTNGVFQVTGVEKKGQTTVVTIKQLANFSVKEGRHVSVEPIDSNQPTQPKYVEKAPDLSQLAA